MKKNQAGIPDTNVVRLALEKYHAIPRKGRKSITTGLPTSKFFESIFKMNEALAKNRKLSDNAILFEWEKQFGELWPKENDRVRRAFLIARLAKIREYRKRWNCGELYRNQIVRVVSWRYDSQGRRVCFSDGVTPLSPEQMAEWINYFKQRAGIRWQPYA